MERHARRGGGKRHGVRVACLFDDLELQPVTGKMYCNVLLSEGEKVAVRAERVTDTREGLSQISSLQNTPLSRIRNSTLLPVGARGKLQRLYMKIAAIHVILRLSRAERIQLIIVIQVN